MKLYKWSGAGNMFVVLDARGRDASPYRIPGRISSLCAEHGTDGLMILADSPNCDFAMEFFNPDGSGGMMCGNGGRCIAAFADMLGVQKSSQAYVFDAPDGLHTAYILAHDNPHAWTVRLGMKNVSEIREAAGGYFLNTGTRHLVIFVPDIQVVDVEVEGRALRHRSEFAPEGTNVNFVQKTDDGLLLVRTFEKGVEGETLACGTGITASAIAAFHTGVAPAAKAPDGTLTYKVRARKDSLAVDFLPSPEGGVKDVFLTGPAELIK